MRSLQTFVVPVFNNTIMDTDTFKLIRKLCVEFELTPDIEFTCYEAYVEYFNRYFVHLEKRFNRMTIEYCASSKQSNQLIDQTLDEVENTSLLHTLALVSICAKYINGHRCDKLIKRFPKYLQANGTPFNTREIRKSEYTVFKFLNFNIKTSDLYVTAHELVTAIVSHNRNSIQFERMHETCNSLLRLIYLYRKKCDEILHYVEQNSYGFNGNEDAKLAAATVYTSTMIIYPQCGNAVLNTIVRQTYLNESLLRKLGQSVQQFYMDYRHSVQKC